jgi:opacity protein-like surface antigen
VRLTVLIALLASASTFASDLGGSPGWVGRLGGGTREFALGNAAGALEPTALDAWWNPARLPLRNGWDVSLSAEQRPLDRQGGALGLATNIGSRLGIGVSVLYRRDADVPLYDADEAQTGTSTPYFMLAQIGLGMRITRSQSIGLSFGVYRENLDLSDYPTYSAPARVDLGWILRGPDTAWAVAAVVRNIGLTSNLVAHEDRNSSSAATGSAAINEGVVPRSLELSGRYRWRIRQGQSVDLLLTPVVQLPDSSFLSASNAELGLRAGVEYAPQSFWRLRAGYEQGSWGAGGSLRILPWGEDSIASRQALWIDYAAMIERETGASLLSVGLRGSL